MLSRAARSTALARGVTARTTAAPLCRTYASDREGDGYYPSASPRYNSSRAPFQPYTPRNGDRERQPRDSYNSNYKPRYRSDQSGQPQTERGPTRKAGLVERIKAGNPPHLITLADLTTQQIQDLLRSAIVCKYLVKEHPYEALNQTLSNKTVALLFSKRSTRTRVASETATRWLGGHPMFLGGADIQLGVNESLEDSAKVIGSMVDGIMARVGPHSDIEELAKHSPVPVINALSDLYHPTQILADILALHEHYTQPVITPEVALNREGGRTQGKLLRYLSEEVDPTACLNGKKIAWIGDTNNIINEILVTVPRFGMHVSVASPKGYDQVDPRVWARLEEAGTTGLVTLTNSPEEALKDADVIVTDTWISMGQEEEKAARLEAFKGYQITNEMVESAGAKPDWRFLHCLPRKQEEVNDDVFYGPRSLVFPEAENRKWTTMAVFNAYFGRWRV